MTYTKIIQDKINIILSKMMNSENVTHEKIAENYKKTRSKKVRLDIILKHYSTFLSYL